MINVRKHRVAIAFGNKDNISYSTYIGDLGELKDILIVPGLKHNLMSIGKLDQAGYSYLVHQSQAYIFKSSSTYTPTASETLFKATRGTDNLYHFQDSQSEQANTITRRQAKIAIPDDDMPHLEDDSDDESNKGPQAQSITRKKSITVATSTKPPLKAIDADADEDNDDDDDYADMPPIIEASDDEEDVSSAKLTTTQTVKHKAITRNYLSTPRNPSSKFSIQERFQLFHNRLNHKSADELKSMLKETKVDGADLTYNQVKDINLLPCLSCAQAKIRARPTLVHHLPTKSPTPID